MPARLPIPAALLGLAAGLVSALLAAAPTEAAVVRMQPEGVLRIDGFQGDTNVISLRHEPRGGGASGAEPRFVIADPAGVFAIGGSSCKVTGPETITCDAGPVSSISAGLGAGDDVMMVDPGVPARYSAAIRGGEGNDVIGGGPGNDRIAGNLGRDVIAGGAGHDRLLGGPGSDGLIGGPGRDTLIGGRGADALFGGKGRDVFRGSRGSDTLLARDGRRDRRLDCGKGGRDLAVVDRRDPRPRGCAVKRRKAKLSRR